MHIAVLLLVLAPLPAHASTAQPQWLVEATAGIDRGVEAFYAAEFEQAVEHLVPAMKVLTEKFDVHPVDRLLLERGAVFLILALRAQEMHEEATDVATGLAQFALPPWGVGQDIAPDARSYLDEMASSVPAPDRGTLTVTVAGEGCAVDIDGDPLVAGSPVTVTILSGVHWVGTACPGEDVSHVRIEVEPDEETRITVGGEPGPPPVVESSPAPAEPEKPDPLLVHAEVHPVPWYGDGLNLALQAAGVAVLGLGAGLLGGSMRIEEKAYRKHSLGYVGLERQALDMEISGWVLMGTGAIALMVGTIRMARTGGEE
jgi:hypothetical protein